MVVRKIPAILEGKSAQDALTTLNALLADKSPTVPAPKSVSKGQSLARLKGLTLHYLKIMGLVESVPGNWGKAEKFRCRQERSDAVMNRGQILKHFLMRHPAQFNEARRRAKKEN